MPSISVNGINVDSGQAYGVGFAQGDFIQHNYHWRDVLTHVQGAHTLKFGYEGWYGDDVEPFQGPWSQPKFSFDNLLQLANDDPNNENGIMYNPATGTQQLWNWDAASRTFGLFVEDTWKARKNLTLTLVCVMTTAEIPGPRVHPPSLGTSTWAPVQPSSNKLRMACQSHAQRTTAFRQQLVQPAHRLRMGSHGQGRLGNSRRIRHLQQLADASQRTGRVPWQPSGSGKSELCKGWNRHRAGPNLRSRNQQQTSVWIYFPNLHGRT